MSRVRVEFLPDILDPARTDFSAGWLRKDPNIHLAERLHPSSFLAEHVS
jgi:hypothetical protein